MTTKANWFVDLEIPSADLDDPPLQVEELAEGIDLRDPAALQRDLATLMARESALYNEGVRCSLKQDSNGDASCSACPLRRHEANDPHTALCTVGVEQERVMTLLVIHRHARPR